MDRWIGYWQKVLLWTAALAGMLILRDLAVHLTREPASGVAGFDLVFLRTPSTFGFLLPFTGLAAAMSVASSPRWDPAKRAAGAIAAILASTGLVVFLLLAHLTPWVEARVPNSLLPDGAVPAVSTRTGQLARYREIAAAAGGDPGLAADAGTLGFMYHLPVAVSWLGVVLAALGLLVGHWTRLARGRVSGVAQRWAAGLGLLLAVTLAHRGGWALATGGAAPMLAAYGILIVPAIVALTLVWVTWVVRGRAADAR